MLTPNISPRSRYQLAPSTISNLYTFQEATYQYPPLDLELVFDVRSTCQVVLLPRAEETLEATDYTSDQPRQRLVTLRHSHPLMQERSSLLELGFKPLRVLLFDPAVDTVASDIKISSRMSGRTCNNEESILLA
jgi:hypothetical protein